MERRTSLVMILGRWAPALACAAGLIATPVMAQHEPPRVELREVPPPLPESSTATAVNPLTVRAPPSPAELKKQIYGFVQSYAASTARLDQIARWREPLCIKVTGVGSLQAEQVTARIQTVAKAVGAAVRVAGCAPNIEIMFTDKPQGLLDSIAARQEEELGYYHRHDTQILKTVTRPIQAWYMTATAGGAGPTAGALFANVASTRFESEIVDDPDSPSPKGCGESRFSACLESVFKHVLVVVDSGRVQDASPDAVADYAAMLSLSQPRSLDGCVALPSVIDLFATACRGRAAPDGLTKTDMAYLMALYKADLEAKKADAQSDIAGRMTKVLVKANPVAR